MFKAGSASIVINNELGTEIQGATNFNKVEYIRDDLETNALWLKSETEELLFLSCDIVGLELDFVHKILPDISSASGVPEDKIILGCSHTHSGPSVLGPTHPDKEVDEKYLENFVKWLCRVSSDAVKSAEPAKIATAKGRAEIGYNRRVCYTDGST